MKVAKPIKRPINYIVRAEAAPWKRGVELLIRDGRHVVKAMEMVEVKDGELIQPSLEISIMAAQTLMDDLWHSGLRPSEGSGSVGQLKATQDHLKDMRRLVFEEKTNG